MQKYIDACVEQNQTTNTHLFGILPLNTFIQFKGSMQQKKTI